MSALLQAFSFLLGGYETTASSLGFTIYNLSANPDKAAKLTEVSVPVVHLGLECLTTRLCLVMRNTCRACATDKLLSKLLSSHPSVILLHGRSSMRLGGTGCQ